MTTINYSPPGPVAAAFLQSNAFVQCLLGPLGSGKTAAGAIKILHRAATQRPGPDGIRRTRWAVIRNTYPELKTTTLKSWEQWMPLTYGKITYDSPITHRVQTADMDMEVFFLAMDRPDDFNKLLSLELTGAWIEEGRHVHRTIYETLTGRVGRYPQQIMGGPSWHGILVTSNMPDTENWIYQLGEKERPDTWAMFRQPSGLSPLAENLQNLPPNYYKNIAAGKDQDWIKVYIEAEYGHVTEGTPVYPNHRDSVHVAAQKIEAVPGVGLLLGADLGLTPALVIGQMLPNGRTIILDELVTENCGVRRFSDLIVPFVKMRYPDNEVIGAYSDPAGRQRSQVDEQAPLDILNANTPWKWRPAPTNDFTIRRETVMTALDRLVDGVPSLMLSPTCSGLRKARAGGYHFAQFRAGMEMINQETPRKNGSSHVAEAEQYLLLGGGAYDVVLNRDSKQKRKARGPLVARDADYNPLESQTPTLTRELDYENGRIGNWVRPKFKR